MKNVLYALLAITSAVVTNEAIAQGRYEANSDARTINTQAINASSVSNHTSNTSTNINATTNYSTSRLEYTGRATTQERENRSTVPADRPVVHTAENNARNSHSYQGYANNNSPTDPGNYKTNASSSPLGTGSYAGTRYCYTSAQSYPCYSSCMTKWKCYTREGERVCIGPPPLPCDFYGFQCCRNMPFFPMLSYGYYFYNEFLFYNDRTGDEHKTQLKSYDGYIVYDKDTMPGIVTMDVNATYLEQPISKVREYSATVKYNDKYLKGIVLYRGNRTVHFARVQESDKRLWRMVHSGKMEVYDNNSGFLRPDNINYATMKVRLQKTGEVTRIKDKKQFVGYLNDAYGLSLNAGNLTWKEIFAYLDRLN